MGWRFRKSFKLAPGVRLNLGKRGASVSASIPGTGLSYSTAGRPGRSGQSSCGGCLALIGLGLAASVILSSVRPSGTPPQAGRVAAVPPALVDVQTPAEAPRPSFPPTPQPMVVEAPPSQGTQAPPSQGIEVANRAESTGQAGVEPAAPEPAAAFEAMRAGLVAREFDEADRARVILVQDGNTLMLKRGSGPTPLRVSLVGVDPPERVESGPAGKAKDLLARDFIRGLVMGQDVYAESDPSVQLDEERRRPVYLYRAEDGLFVNLEVIGRGYGFCWEDVAFLSWDLFQGAEDAAEADGAGLWDPSLEVPTVASSDATERYRAVLERRRRRTRQARERTVQAQAALMGMMEGPAMIPFGGTGGGGGTVSVRGYYRSDGTYVRPHTRSAPR